MIGLFTRNIYAKVGSLATAGLLFWYVQANRTITRAIQVRVVPMKLKKGLMYASKYPAYLNVKLRGPRQLMDFPVSDFKVRLYTNRQRVGKRLPFRTRLPDRLPAGVEASLAKIVRLDVDRVMTRRLPVEPVAAVDGLAPGTRIGYYWINPRFLRVRGPAETVSAMKVLRTRVIEVKGPVGMFERAIVPEGLPPFVELAPDESFEVRYHATIIRNPTDVFVKGERHVVIDDLKTRCINGFRDYIVTTTPSVKVTLAVAPNRAAPTARQLEGLVYCVAGKGGIPRKQKDALLEVRLKKRYRKHVSVRSVSKQRVALAFKKSAAATRRKGYDVFRRKKKQP